MAWWPGHDGNPEILGLLGISEEEAAGEMGASGLAVHLHGCLLLPVPS